MGYRAHQGPAGDLKPLVGRLAGTTQVTEGHAASLQLAAITNSGVGSNQPSWVAAVPAYSAGDLVIIHVACDGFNGVSGMTWPTGPDGETIALLADRLGYPGGEALDIGWYIATDDYAGGTLTLTPAEEESWLATVAVAPAGSFDATDPFGATATTDTGSTTTTITSPAFTANADDAGGLLCIWIAVDGKSVNDDPPAGWTDLANEFVTATSGVLSVRDAPVTASESIAAATWTISASDTYTTFAYVLRRAE